MKDLIDKHNKILSSYSKVKSLHLQKIANKILKNEEKFRKLKEKKINTNFLTKF